MLLDRALRLAFRNFSTLFLLVAVFTITSNLIYGFVFRDVFRVHELHPFIAELRPGRQVLGVGQDHLEQAREAHWVLVGIEIALLPLLVLCARRILVVDESGGVPTVVDSLLHPLAGGHGAMSWRLGWGGVGAVIAGLGIAIAVAWLFDRAGMLLIEPLPDGTNFVAMPTVRGVALALGAPFLLCTAVVAGRAPRTREVREIST